MRSRQMEEQLIDYYTYWGKSNDNMFHLLPYHCLDVAAVTQVILTRHHFLLKKISAIMGLKEEDTRLWLVFLSGIHDSGKFAESFQQLRADLRTQYLGHNPPEKTNYNLRHDSLGYLLWFERYQGLLKHYQSNGFDLSSFASVVLENPDKAKLKKLMKKLFPHWLAPVMGHHGFPPECKNRIKDYFQVQDIESARCFVEDWFALVKPDIESILEYSDDRTWIAKQKKASWLIAGLTVLCDWIGSNSDDFQFESEHYSLEDYWNKKALPQAEKAIDKIGLLPAKVKKECCVGDIFPYIKEATPLQKLCSEIKLSDEPQLFILEDVTGAGKTEAALMLAYRLMEKDLAQGFFVGLPTMATANAMLERMAYVYRNFFTEDSQPDAVLSHSARHLSKLFQSSFLEQDKQINAKYNKKYSKKEETISVQCNRWLADHRKKSLLADVGVGTIDQVLLGVLPVRHQSLRLYGLANKVLILDEIHAYDAYTGTLLNTLLEFHAALGGSVILLSATLSKSQRQSYVSAFNKGMGGYQKPELNNTSFPLLTQFAEDTSKECAVATRKTVQRKVNIRFKHRQEEIIEQIKEVAIQGECVCWIRNTVHDAREAFEMLSAIPELSENNVHLFHSRYTLGDRLDIEQDCLKLFGLQSVPEQRKGQILVATQVIEQSLDLDFDRMITDLAPVDLLIQRAGRLKRHIRDASGKLITDGREDKRGIAELIIYAPEFTNTPQNDWYQAIFPKACYVYPDTGLLWLTSRILEQKKALKMPDDARELIEEVYGKTVDDLPEGLQDSHLQAEGTQMGHKGMAAFNTLKYELGYQRDYRLETPWDDEARFPTRLGEDTQTLYLARWENNKLLPWNDGGIWQWDMSSANVNKGQLKELNRIQEEVTRAVTSLKEKVPVFDDYSFIVPLQKINGAWQAEGYNDNGENMIITYDSQQGLMIRRKE